MCWSTACIAMPTLLITSSFENGTAYKSHTLWKRCMTRHRTHTHFMLIIVHYGRRSTRSRRPLLSHHITKTSRICSCAHAHTSKYDSLHGWTLKLISGKSKSPLPQRVVHYLTGGRKCTSSRVSAQSNTHGSGLHLYCRHTNSTRFSWITFSKWNIERVHEPIEWESQNDSKSRWCANGANTVTPVSAMRARWKVEVCILSRPEFGMCARLIFTTRYEWWKLIRFWKCGKTLCQLNLRSRRVSGRDFRGSNTKVFDLDSRMTTTAESL